MLIDSPEDMSENMMGRAIANFERQVIPY